MMYRLYAKKNSIFIGLIIKLKKPFGGATEAISDYYPKSKVTYGLKSNKCCSETNVILSRTYDVTDRTMFRSLKNNGLKARTIIKKTLLNKGQRKARLKFAKAFESFNIEDWMKVMWYDET